MKPYLLPLQRGQRVADRESVVSSVVDGVGKAWYSRICGWRWYDVTGLLDPLCWQEGEELVEG